MSLMARVDRFAGVFGLAPKVDGRPRRVQLPPWANDQGWSDFEDPDRATYELQANQFRSSPAFFAALTRIAEAAATSKLGVFDGPGEDAEAIVDHPLLDLLRRPAPGMDWLGLDRFTLIESLAMCLTMGGDAFLYLGGRTAPTQPPGLLIPLRPDRVELLGRGNTVIGYRYTVAGQYFDISPEDIIHFKRFNPLSEIYGLGQAEPAYLAVEADISAQRHNRALFRNQARLSTVVESDLEFIDDDQRKLMEKWFKDKFTGGPEKAGQVAFLWAGFKARDLGMSNRDAEYIAGRKMNREDIFMAAGVHPALMLSDDVPLANAKTAEYLVARYTISPLLTRLANRFNAELLPLYGDGHTLRFLDVVPRDTQQQLQQHSIYLDRGVLSINEARADLGMAPAAWGDQSWPSYQASLAGPAPAEEEPIEPAVDDAELDPPKLLGAGQRASAELQALLLAAARVVARG